MGEDEGGFVADAAGGVLVDFFAGEIGEIQHFAGIQHDLGERGEFGTGHAANPDGHEPSGHLVVGNVAASVAGDQEVDLFAGVFAGVAFFPNEIDGAHACAKVEAGA